LSVPRGFRAAAFFEILLTLIYVVRVAWTGEWIGIAGGLLRVAFMGLLAVAVIRRGSRIARWAFVGVEIATALTCLSFALVTLPGGYRTFDALLFAMFVLYLVLATAAAIPGRDPFRDRGSSEAGRG
jgi:hypothetical protein